METAIFQEIAQQADFQNIQPTFEPGSDEDLQQWCDRRNAKAGTLTGYDCTECINRGFFAIVEKSDYGSVVAYKDCSCKNIRKSLDIIKTNGLDKASFDNFEDSEDWQKHLKATVHSFVDNTKGEWLYISGQTGCGKTHICSAALRALAIRYRVQIAVFKWQENAKRLKQLVNDAEYASQISHYKTTKVLYIDDLFKCKRGESPTNADVNLAFEIIDYRYCKNLLTVISSEFSIDDIIDFDEALGGRIKEMCGKFILNIAPDKSKNYRLR